MNLASPSFDRPEYSPVPHSVTFTQFREKFGYNEHRSRQIDGLRKAALELRRAGCSVIYVGGSFTSDKEFPSDYDACFNPIGVSGTLSPLLIEERYLTERRNDYLGDWLIGRPDDGPAGYWYRFLAFDDRTGRRNAMYAIKLDLVELTA